ncbi:MAG: hypothetical protein K2U26_17525 [Cyclobacteriaceae bacterium]|nr:hypothetical protein [Cyclobacteriaceae bacterium]
MVRFISVLIFYLASISLVAQEVEVEIDSAKAKADTVQTIEGKRVITIETYAKRFNPRKALLYSAILPGMGQVYNKKYWKLPIVYGGFFMLGYLASTYNTFYNQYKGELFGLLNDPTSKAPSGLNVTQLRNQIENYRRQRDYFIVLTGFWYVLQFIDAHVDAHLMEFKLNPQLKVRVEPNIEQNALIGRTSGVLLVLKF